jgi:hypothetical protein
MSSEHKEVRDILQVLGDKLEICADEGISPEDVASQVISLSYRCV